MPHRGLAAPSGAARVSGSSREGDKGAEAESARGSTCIAAAQALGGCLTSAEAARVLLVRISFFLSTLWPPTALCVMRPLACAAWMSASHCSGDKKPAIVRTGGSRFRTRSEPSKAAMLTVE